MPTFRKRGDKWRVEIRRRGVYRSGTFYTRAEAREWATAIEREIDTGKHRERSTATLGDAFKRYAREVSPTKKGRRWEQVRLTMLQRDPLSDIRFRDITPDLLTKWRDTRLNAVTAASVNRDLALMSAVFATAQKPWGLIDHNPIKDVKRLREPPHRDRRITDDEIRRICWALGFNGSVHTKSDEVAVAFLLALETAMRLGELTGIQRRNIFPRHVRLADTKNSDRRDVPLSREAIRLIGLLPNTGQRLFTVSAGSASTLFRKARDRAKIEGLTFHDSRHEACTRLARKIDALDLARMIGHRDLKSLLVYFNPRPAEIAERLDAAASPTFQSHQETSGDDSLRQSAQPQENRDGR